MNKLHLYLEVCEGRKEKLYDYEKRWNNGKKA